MNLVPATLDDSGLLIGGDVRLPRAPHLSSLAPGPYVLGIHPGDVALDTKGIAAEVELAEISGSETFLHLRHGDIRMVAHLSRVHARAEGEGVQVALDAGRAFLFTPDGQLAAAPAAASGV
jgi:glycerol transport system ATP-binding protein